MKENDLIEEDAPPVFSTSQDIIRQVMTELVPLAMSVYRGLLETGKNEKILKETADKVMEIASVTKTETPGGGVSFHFSSDQVQAAFGDLKGLKDVKIKQIEDKVKEEENGEE